VFPEEAIEAIRKKMKNINIYISKYGHTVLLLLFCIIKTTHVSSFDQLV